jgi:hypothetical protein
LLEGIAEKRTLLASLHAGVQQKARILAQAPLVKEDVSHNKISTGLVWVRR